MHHLRCHTSHQQRTKVSQDNGRNKLISRNSLRSTVVVRFTTPNCLSGTSACLHGSLSGTTFAGKNINKQKNYTLQRLQLWTQYLRQCLPPPVCHVSWVKCHISYNIFYYKFKNKGQIDEASWWRVYYQWGFPVWS